MDVMSSEEARLKFRALLTKAEKGKPTLITRWGEPVAVVVTPDWYEMAVALLEREEGKQ